MGGELGEMLGLLIVAVVADWSIGRKVGPIRNQRMLDEHRPNLVVAFPGKRGTADMVIASSAQSTGWQQSA